MFSVSSTYLSWWDRRSRVDGLQFVIEDQREDGTWYNKVFDLECINLRVLCGSVERSRGAHAKGI